MNFELHPPETMVELVKCYGLVSENDETTVEWSSEMHGISGDDLFSYLDKIEDAIEAPLINYN